MKTVELFSGTKSFSKIAASLGYETYTVDVEEKYSPDLIQDLTKPLPDVLKEKLSNADIIWMSPPCQTFSMAAGNTHWTADRLPKTEKAVLAQKMLALCKEIADMCVSEGKTFIIENPRARARWFLPPEWRQTAWYCQYGDNRAKPTDFWTNIQWEAKGCKNGNPDCHHERAPRGSKTGTQGLKGNQARSVVPPELIRELLHLSQQK